jgi:hypothetical protein
MQFAWCLRNTTEEVQVTLVLYNSTYLTYLCNEL